MNPPDAPRAVSGDAAPRVAVVVLNWNGREDTLACLQSLRACSYPALDVIVVDNGSEDGSEAAIRDAFPDMDLVQTGENLGFAGGNNAGIERALAAGADFVLLLNNDTLVESDFVEPMVAAARADPTVGIVGATIAYAGDPERLWAFGGGVVDLRTGTTKHVQRVVDPRSFGTRGWRRHFITGCAMLLRREVLERVGVLDTGYFHFCEDVDLCLRAQVAGYGVTVAPDARLRHVVSATIRVGSPTFVYYNLRSRLRLLRRFGPEGVPSRWALAVLWLRLWRPALEAGHARRGWHALRRAWRDAAAGRTGPAPADL